MATLNDYKGSVGLVAGLKPISTGYPLMEAHDIQVGVGDVRLDAKLASLDSSTGSSSDTPDVNGTTTWSRIKAIENRLGLSTDSSNRSGDTAWSRINKLRDDIEHIRTQVIGATYFPSQSNPYTDNYNVNSEDRIATVLRAHDANFAEEFVEGKSYKVGDYVIYNHALYRCKANITGVWNATKWDRVNLSDAMEDVVTNISDILDSNIGKSTDAANATGTTAWSRINAIQSNLGKSTDSYTIVGGSNTVDSNTTVWTRIKALERGLGSISDLDKPATVIGTSVWSVAQYAQNMASEALDALGITYTLNTSGGQYTGGATVSVSTVLGKSTDTANASGTSAWSRINAIQPSLGTSSDAANAAGTSAWSRIKAIQSSLSTLEAEVGLSGTPSASSLSSKVTALQSAVGQPSDAANSGNLAALYPRIKAIEAELGKMSNTAIRNVWDSNSTVWGLLKGLQNDFNALLNYLSITRIAGSGLTTSGLINQLQDYVDNIDALENLIGSSSDAANLSGPSIWSIINKLKSIAGGSGYSVLTLASGTTATNITSFLSGVNHSNLIILNGSTPSSSDAITALYNAGFISSNSSSSVSSALNKWYYYNTSTSKWASGGSLSVTNNIDTTLTQNGMAAEAAATGLATRIAEYTARDSIKNESYGRNLKYYYNDINNTIKTIYNGSGTTDSIVNGVLHQYKEYFEVSTVNTSGDIVFNPGSGSNIEIISTSDNENQFIPQIFENGKIYELSAEAIGGYAEKTGSSTIAPLEVGMVYVRWNSIVDGNLNDSAVNDLSVNSGPLNIPGAYGTSSTYKWGHIRFMPNDPYLSMPYAVDYDAPTSDHDSVIGYRIRFRIFKDIKLDHVIVKVLVKEYDSGPLPKFKEQIEQGLMCKNLIGNVVSTYYPIDLPEYDVITITRSAALPSGDTHTLGLYNESKQLIKTISLSPLITQKSFQYLHSNSNYVKYMKLSGALTNPIQVEYGTRSTAYEAYFAPRSVSPGSGYMDDSVESPLSFTDSSNDGHIVISYKQWIDPAIEELPLFTDPNNDGNVVIS